MDSKYEVVVKQGTYIVPSEVKTQNSKLILTGIDLKAKVWKKVLYISNNESSDTIPGHIQFQIF